MNNPITETGRCYAISCTDHINKFPNLCYLSQFQQVINITKSDYSSYINYNGNEAYFEYYYANGTIILSWIETNSSGTLITWANLKQRIPTTSSMTIYLGFVSKSTSPLSNSNTKGIGKVP